MLLEDRIVGTHAWNGDWAQGRWGLLGVLARFMMKVLVTKLCSL